MEVSTTSLVNYMPNGSPRRPRVIQLYYITHVKNVPSILERGILSHEKVEAEGIQFEPVYDREIVKSRRARNTPDGKSLWHYANMYFQPRNPMLYRVTCERPVSEIAVLAIDFQWVIGQLGALITTGNAASTNSEIFPISKRGTAYPRFRDALGLEFWKEEDSSKRRIMAECLVPDIVPPEAIKTIFVANQDAAAGLRKRLDQSGYGFVDVIPEPSMFFQPSKTVPLTSNLSLVEGDMFFSRMQTLTVSVNCVGVMGKGLASRAKYQFPDVYVKYQDLCRNHTLQLGKPYLYKREGSFDYQLADEPQTLTAANAETWFLLFPTKKHWREKASMEGIEKGLKWVQTQYADQGIKSLSVPALGAGLGRLDWSEVGPAICQSLAPLGIPVQVYLPAEKKIPDKELTKDFLLPKNSTLSVAR